MLIGYFQSACAYLYSHVRLSMPISMLVLLIVHLLMCDCMSAYLGLVVMGFQLLLCQGMQLHIIYIIQLHLVWVLILFGMHAHWPLCLLALIKS